MLKVLQSSSKIEDISRKAKPFSRERDWLLNFSTIFVLKLYSYENHAQIWSRDHFFVLIYLDAVCLSHFPFAVFIIDIIMKSVSVVYFVKNLKMILRPSFQLSVWVIASIYIFLGNVYTRGIPSFFFFFFSGTQAYVLIARYALYVGISIKTLARK